MDVLGRAEEVEASADVPALTVDATDEPAADPESAPAPEPEVEQETTHDADTSASEPSPDPEPAPDREPAPAIESGWAESPPSPPSAVETPRRTVGQAIAERLAAAGARFAFTVPGESFLGLLEGLEGAGVRIVATRHEGGAAFMAAAASRLMGKPQLCLGSRAVGAANLAIGIHAARADSVAMVAVVGQVRREHRGREAFQEADLVGSIGRLAKWAGEADDPLGALALIDQALARATEGRPGPVLVSVPEDLLDKMLPASTGTSRHRSPLPTAAALPPDPDAVRAALRTLASSKRGVIFAGGGVLAANAGRRLLRLADALALPVIAAWRRPDVVPNGHPLYLGMAGYAAPSTVLPRLLEADAVLVIGCRLSEVTTFGYQVPAAGSRWVHVDMEPRVGSAGLPPAAISIESDAGRFVDAAYSILRGAAIDAESRAQRMALAEEDRQAFTEARVVDTGDWDGPGVHPGRVITELGKALSPDAILTTDAGNFGGWAARGFRFRRAGTFLGPTSGAMGYGLPAAIAASLALPKRQVVALTGDGGFAMTMVELETAVREGVAPLVLVFDNQRYGTISMHQEREGRQVTGTLLGPIDFAAAARAFGADGHTVERDDELPDVLRDALASGRPSVIHLRLDPRWVSVDQPAIMPDSPGSSASDMASAP